MSNKILFVDDDLEYGETIKRLLETSGYETTYMSSPFEALEIIIEEEFDLVISDYQMEAIDGNRLLSYVKKMRPATRTMLLTANPTRETELNSLDIEVDEFVRKEVHADVLLKYIDKVLHTKVRETTKTNILTSDADKLEIFKERQEVYQDGELVSLTPKEYEILVFLIENHGNVISREKFLEEIWDVLQVDHDLRVVDNHIKSLRKKLHLISIKSIRGFGYKWNE